jgi:hypothetical protein
LATLALLGLTPLKCLSHARLTVDCNVKLKFNYSLIVVDSCSRCPFSYSLRSFHAKNVCDALVKIFEITGMPTGMTIVSNKCCIFRCALTQKFMKRFVVSSCFATAYHHPVSIVENQIQVSQNTIAQLSYAHNHNWVSYLGPALIAMCSTVNENLGCPVSTSPVGIRVHAERSIIASEWSGQNDLSPNVSKSITEYFDHFKSKLETAEHYATTHLEREQQQISICGDLWCVNIIFEGDPNLFCQVISV